MKFNTLLIPLALLGVALLWFGIYEIVAFVKPEVPTISSQVRPIIQAHLVTAVFILFLILGFIAALIYDWYISKG
jgi:multisubunit Na+/H+ antiporter MnhC subunit